MYGTIMIARIRPAGRMPTAALVAAAQGGEDRLQKRRQDEQAPEAVDDAGDGREHLDEERADAAQPARGDLRQEGGRADAQRHGDQHGDGRGGHGAVDEGQGAELPVGRAPESQVCVDEEARRRWFAIASHDLPQSGRASAAARRHDDQHGRRLAEQPEDSVRQTER